LEIWIWLKGVRCQQQPPQPEHPQLEPELPHPQQQKMIMIRMMIQRQLLPPLPELQNM